MSDAMRENHPLASKELDIDTFCSFNPVLISYDGDGFSRTIDIALEKIEKKEMS
ncbi:hypothetical protein [Acinetobacter sp. TSRC1-2]|uniref:hypothetical protein n=1 Tax=unclassified Acinetobacter TaxID=196816 RepID=UPI003CF5057B